MPNNDLISRAAARDVINTWGRLATDDVRMDLLHHDLNALPAVDAIPIAMLDKYENEPMLKTSIHLIKNIWQYERDKHIEGGKDNAKQ